MLSLSVHQADVGGEFDVGNIVDVVFVDVLVPVGVLGAPDGNVCFLREAALIYSELHWHVVGVAGGRFDRRTR